jgi:DNA polymerase-3 subunit delta
VKSAEAALADLEGNAGVALGTVVLIHGEETYYHRRLLRAIKARTLDASLEAFNYVALERGQATLGAVRAAVLTPPVMAARRLVVVRDPADLSGGRPAGPGAEPGSDDESGSGDAAGEDPAAGVSAGPGPGGAPVSAAADGSPGPDGDGSPPGPGPAEAARLWSELLALAPPETRLVLCLSRELPSSSPLLKAAGGLRPPAEVIRCLPATARSAETWVRKLVSELGGRIDPQASQALVLRSGTSLSVLEREIEKLLVYVGDRGVITTADVAAAATPSAEASVFEMVDHLGARRPYRAVTTLRRLVEQGEVPLRLMAMVSRQVRLIFITAEMLACGAPVAEVEKRLGLPTWVVRGYLAQARNFDRGQLTAMMRDLARMDLDAKTGRREPVEALELFILRQCR